MTILLSCVTDIYTYFMRPTNPFHTVSQILDKLYPPTENYMPIISEERHEWELKKLLKTIEYEQFFFVLDLVSRKVIHINGLKKWLGYDEDNFTLAKYISIIHPRHLESLNVFAQATFETANSKEYQVSFMEQKYSVQLPLFHKNGSYISTKRSLYPFQISKDGKILAYLNHFTIVKDDFDATIALNPEVKTITHKSQKDLANISVKQKAKKIIANTIKIAGFNQRQLKVLKAVVDNPSKNQGQIFDELGIKSTRNTDISRIITQARLYYEHEDFTTLKEIALFLQREGLI